MFKFPVGTVIRSEHTGRRLEGSEAVVINRLYPTAIIVKSVDHLYPVGYELRQALLGHYEQDWVRVNVEDSSREPVFKVGDKVEIDSNRYIFVQSGDIGTVIEVTGSSFVVQVGDFTRAFKEDQLKPYVPHDLDGAEPGTIIQLNEIPPRLSTFVKAGEDKWYHIFGSLSGAVLCKSYHHWSDDEIRAEYNRRNGKVVVKGE